MRKVTIVVPVLIISCHVSLKPKTGPVTAHKSSAPSAIANATGCPAAREVHFANRVKKEVDFMAIQNRNLNKISEPVSVLRVPRSDLHSHFLEVLARLSHTRFRLTCVGRFSSPMKSV